MFALLALLPDHLVAQAATCTVNGEPADCGKAGAIALAILIPLFLIFAVCAVFWIITLIHALKHPDVPNRTLWIVLHFILLGPLAGPVYFFAVKRPYDKRTRAAHVTMTP